MTTNVALFVLAAFFEIAGCFAFWVWLRRGGTPLVALVGVGSLIAFAFALTLWIPRLREERTRHMAESTLWRRWPGWGLSRARHPHELT